MRGGGGGPELEAVTRRAHVDQVEMGEGAREVRGAEAVLPADVGGAKKDDVAHGGQTTTGARPFWGAREAGEASAPGRNPERRHRSGMELSHIDAMVELLRAENGYVTKTSAANFAGAGPPFALLERFPGRSLIYVQAGAENVGVDRGAPVAWRHDSARDAFRSPGRRRHDGRVPVEVDSRPGRMARIRVSRSALLDRAAARAANRIGGRPFGSGGNRRPRASVQPHGCDGRQPARAAVSNGGQGWRDLARRAGARRKGAL